MHIVFIGGGHMTHALVSGLVRQSDSSFTIEVIDRNHSRRERFRQDFVHDEVSTASVIPSDSTDADAIILAVRPNQLEDVFFSLKTKSLLISVAAGVRCQQFCQWQPNLRIMRVMPNTPAQVSLGMSILYAGDVNIVDQKIAATIFSKVGEIAWVKDESDLDKITAVSGSGPAYVYYFIEAMEQAALQMNLSPDISRQAILQTFRGAVTMIEETGHSATDLRNAVAVAGGTTEKAISHMQAAKINQTITEAMNLCADKASAIGQSIKKSKSTR